MIHVAGWVFLRYSISMGGKLFLDNRLKNCIIEVVRELDDNEYEVLETKRKALNLSSDGDSSPVDQVSASNHQHDSGDSRFKTKWRAFQKVARSGHHRKYVNAKVLKFDPKTGLHTVHYHNEYRSGYA